MCVRVRPPREDEDEVIRLEKYQVVLDHKGKRRRFRYDGAFGCTETNGDVYASLEKELIESARNGYNVSLLAYGQTGSGKSHSMWGTDTDPGLVPRFAHDLLPLMASVVEIYNEKIRDLLGTGGPLRVRESPNFGPYVDGATIVDLGSKGDLQKMLKRAHRQRTVASTALNDTSSRAHTVITLRLLGRDHMSTINLVDLAGSERLIQKQKHQHVVKETTGHINKSLAALAKVISILAGKNPQQFVPYRDSTLTHLLKESLGGNARTTMIACLAPGGSTHESLSTLRYADRARSIVTHARTNDIPKDDDDVIKRLKAQVASLKEELKVARDLQQPLNVVEPEVDDEPQEQSISALRKKMHADMRERVAEYEAQMANAAVFNDSSSQEEEEEKLPPLVAAPEAPPVDEILASEDETYAAHCPALEADLDRLRALGEAKIVPALAIVNELAVVRMRVAVEVRRRLWPATNIETGTPPSETFLGVAAVRLKFPVDVRTKIVAADGTSLGAVRVTCRCREPPKVGKTIKVALTIDVCAVTDIDVLTETFAIVYKFYTNPPVVAQCPPSKLRHVRALDPSLFSHTQPETLLVTDDFLAYLNSGPTFFLEFRRRHLAHMR